jgi:hypothetical protein
MMATPPPPQLIRLELLEAEDADSAHRAGEAAVVESRPRLRAVLNDRQVELARDGEQFIYRRWMPEQVNNNDGARARYDRLPHFSRLDAICTSRVSAGTVYTGTPEAGSWMRPPLPA